MCITETFSEVFFEVDIRVLYVFFCKMDTFLVYFLTQVRNLLSMTITVERTKIIWKIKTRRNKSISKTNSNSLVLTPSAIKSDVNELMNKVAASKLEKNVKNIKVDMPQLKSDASTLLEDTSSLTDTHVQHFTKNLYVNLVIRKMEIVTFTSICILILMNSHFIFLLELNLKVDTVSSNEAYEAFRINTTTQNHVYPSLPSKNYTINTDYECSPDNSPAYSYFLRHVWFWLDMIVYFLIPFFTMFISFFFIKTRLNRTNQYYTSYMSKSSRSNTKIWQKRIKKNQHILIKLLVVNSYFFFSSTPYYVYNFLIDYPNQNDNLLTFFNILFYSNNAFNFFLYGISSEQFRKVLIQVVKC